MSVISLLELVNTAVIALQVAVLIAVVWRKAYKEQPFFLAFLAASLLHQIVGNVLLFHRHATNLSVHQAYLVLFFSSWVGQTIESVLIVLCIYQVYGVLMQPFSGLQRLGRIVFRWVAAISVALAVTVALAPHVAGVTFFATLVSQVQQGVSILTVCLLLFVSFATRPLGLTFRSRVFGVTLGLGVMATTDLVQAAWLGTSGARSVYSPIFLVSGVGVLVGLAVWGIYFVRREPARKLLLLPTTSPFFLWNRISEALGDAPGEVAIHGLSPEMFMPAELEAFRSAPRTPAPVVEMPQPQVAQR